MLSMFLLDPTQTGRGLKLKTTIFHSIHFFHPKTSQYRQVPQNLNIDQVTRVTHKLYSPGGFVPQIFHKDFWDTWDWKVR